MFVPSVISPRYGTCPFVPDVTSAPRPPVGMIGWLVTCVVDPFPFWVAKKTLPLRIIGAAWKSRSLLAIDPASVDVAVAHHTIEPPSTPSGTMTWSTAPSSCMTAGPTLMVNCELVALVMLVAVAVMV